MGDLNDVLAKLGACLALKIGVLHLLTVRTRLMTSNMKRVANKGEEWEA